jgi:hypothetical protein
MARVNLGERHEVLLRDARGGRQISAVELVEAGTFSRARSQRESEAVAAAPRIRAENEVLRLRCDALFNETGVSLEAARSEDDWHAVGKPSQRLAEPNLAGTARQSLGQSPRVEADTGRERVAGLTRDHPGTQPLEPGEGVVQPLPDDPLKVVVAARALLPEALEIPVAPDHAAREEHRATRPVALLVDDDMCAELAGTHSGGQAGHPRAGDDEAGQGSRRERTSACARRTRA